MTRMTTVLLIKRLYEQWQLPIFQNRMYVSAEKAKAWLKCDMRLMEDLGSSLVCNAAFQAEVVVYDAY